MYDYVQAFTRPVGDKMTNTIFLGNDSDPQPVFRHEGAHDSDWPERAVMMIAFTRTAFPAVSRSGLPDATRIDYFDETGWPVDLPEERRAELSPAMKREFQVYPWDWRNWGERGWRCAVNRPRAFAIARRRIGAVRQVVQLTSTLSR
jgi:hypothetical protein